MPNLARQAVNQTVYLFITFFILAFRPFAWRPRALRFERESEPNRSMASLEVESDDDGTQPIRLKRFSMGVDWRWLWTEVGTVLMVIGVAESSMQMFRHSFERAVHLHLALGFSKGLGLMIICLIVIAQVAACANLMAPVLYLTTGSIAPSTVLAVTLWFETLVFGDMNDTATLVRSISLTGTALMLALCRYDRQARNLMSQLPASGALLNIESNIRKLCTAMRTGIVLPPAGFIALFCAFYCNPFWRTHGILYEWYRGRFEACIASASLLFLIGGQDSRHNLFLGLNMQRFEKRMEMVTDWVLRRKATVLGQSYQGRKKAL